MYIYIYVCDYMSYFLIQLIHPNISHYWSILHINFRGSGGIDPEKGFKKEIEEKKKK